MKKIILVILILFICLPCFAINYKEIVRVGISDNSFSKLYYPVITIGATSDYTVYDKQSNTDIITLPCSKPLKIELQNNKLNLYSDTLIKSSLHGPLGVKTQGLLKINGLKRLGKDALYRGEFEIAIANNGHTGFNIINVLPIQDYLKGVVPNEMPVSFGLEALKAQTIAARNYILRPRTVIYHNFDVCDSVQSQVYFGANTEHPLSNQAVDETLGLFALYNNRIILALYSSTAGGYTENYENVFLSPKWDTKPVEPLPYLRGKPDRCFDLKNENDVVQFYVGFPDSYDTESKFYRWQVCWDRAELEDVLKKTLKQNAKSGYIEPDYTEESFGTLKDIRVKQRGVSGKAISVEIVTDKGIFEVKKELIIRKIFQKNSKLLYSANFVVNNLYDEFGNLCSVTFLGGGYGHGVGLSQYGAGKMAKMGYKFDDILQHYYTGIAIGTCPVEVSNTSVNMNFAAPNSKATLFIDNPNCVKNFTFIINDVEINLEKDCLSKCASVRLDKYLKDENNIVFLPINNQSKTVKVWIEVYSPKDEN